MFGSMWSIRVTMHCVLFGAIPKLYLFKKKNK